VNPYEKAGNIFTRSERKFYYVLCSVADGGWIVFPKLRLEDLVPVKRSVSGRGTYRNFVKSRHVDFVLCTLDTLSPVPPPLRIVTAT
jgi:Protein of unknown function (DUF2726)